MQLSPLKANNPFWKFGQMSRYWYPNYWKYPKASLILAWFISCFIFLFGVDLYSFHRTYLSWFDKYVILNSFQMTIYCYAHIKGFSYGTMVCSILSCSVLWSAREKLSAKSTLEWVSLVHLYVSSRVLPSFFGRNVKFN